MKDKRATQREDRSMHKAILLSAKESRRKGPELKRPDPTKSERPIILIVCEGQNTEPSYFKQFKLSFAQVKALGNGNNTISLVQQAIKLKGQGNYEKVWCVFDKDQFPANNFNNAITMAHNNGLGVAYSNQSFEYWLILHFEDHQGGKMNRDKYEKKLNHYIVPLGAYYDGQGSKKVTESLFDLLMGTDTKTKERRVQLAIERAKRNYNQRPHHNNPAVEESTTTVYELVEELLDYT